MNILVVDDNAINLRVITQSLESIGAKIFSFSNGEEALNNLEEANPDLLVLDIMMPFMSGFELLEKIRLLDKFKNIPTIFITAINDIETELKGLELGAIDFITKPINPDLIKSRIKNVLSLINYRKNLENIVEIKTSEIKRSNSYFENILNSLNFSIIGVNSQYQVIQCNSWASRYFGISIKEITNLDFFEIAPYLRNERKTIDKAIRDGKIQRISKRIRVSEKGTIYEDIGVFPILNNQSSGVVIMIDDVTRDVELHGRVVQREKIASLGDLVAGIFHELNNPLSGVIQNTQILTSRIDLGRETNKNACSRLGIDCKGIDSYLKERRIIDIIDSIGNSGKQCLRIIKNLSALTKKDSNVESNVLIGDVVKQCIEILESDFSLNSGIDFKTIVKNVEIEQNLPGVYCENSKIIQSVLNILRFIIRNFNPKVSNSPVIGITAYRENSKINIEIRDNGPIIPLNDLDLNLVSYNMTSNNYWYYIALSDYIIRNSLNGEFILDISSGNTYKILLDSN